MGRIMGQLYDEMLAAFLEAEPHDAHIRARREVKAAAEAEQVSASVALRRSISGATGVPEMVGIRINTQTTRRVPDPLLTDAEYYHKRQQRPTDPYVGKTWVTENAMERIGALCFIRRREAHHEMAAERFKALYEARYGIGNPALDASRVVVDTSPIAHDSGMAAKIDNTWRLKQAETHDKAMFNRLVALLVLCEPAGDGLSSRPRQRNVDLVLNDLDRLSTLWGLVKRAA